LDTGFVDLAGAQAVLKQREGRTGAAMIDWLSKRSDALHEGIVIGTEDAVQPRDAKARHRNDQNRDRQHPPPRDQAVHRNPLDPLAFR